jgi:hypothetical protein
VKMGELTWWRMWLVLRLWPRRACHQRTSESGEFTYRIFIDDGAREVSLSIRDTTVPRHYSRESVFRMLRIVRENEQRMGWKCPEPFVANVEGDRP